ncbi:MAG: selenide, water dikinase [Candidatus Magnetoglobus multicellularis str. Araruama]|uniref:Selenide, water dikinase n=1 Tax=Candidatus Magnetoglobus multicellularis str. Araruama TaxID=890399 RepID=A0A1V1PFA2_9BACT|nr:MAG: selenide, water dikinase [Candidatus Magnetoglobus multicellularis str. Araruama]
MGPGDLKDILSVLPNISHPDLLVDCSHSDDAGVIRLTDDLALVQTVDFFTPIVDDAYDFGRIAAANSFSDIYAMGAEPLTAMNIVCFPTSQLSQEILRNTLSGGHDVIQAAGALLLGGHSVDDQEFKYGLAVTGTIHPDKILTNSKARPRDVCILTKPLGTGIVSTAIKGQLAGQDEIDLLVEITSSLNKNAATVLKAFSVSACTDITGFGLAGHVCEMALASHVQIQLDSNRLPILNQAVEYARMGLIPAGAYANKTYFQQYVHVESTVPQVVQDIFYDPQTSGGLFFSIPEQYAEDCLSDLVLKRINAVIVGTVNKVKPGEPHVVLK